MVCRLAQGALAAWASPVRAAFDVPNQYMLICGLSIGYASDQPVNQFNPGHGEISDLQIPKQAPWKISANDKLPVSSCNTDVHHGRTYCMDGGSQRIASALNQRRQGRQVFG